MKRTRWLLALALLTITLPLNVRGETRGLWQVSPFLIDYQENQTPARDYAALCCLEEENPLAAYRTKPGQEPETGPRYPENLEAGGISGRLRGVLLGGYPRRSPAQLESAANPWLLSRGLEPVCQLQAGEALTATQLALWHLLDPGQNAGYGGWKALGGKDWSSLSARTREEDSLLEVPTEHTATNIASLARFLENLPPVAAGKVLVDGSALKEATCRYAEGEGGITLEVTVPFSLTLGSEDRLTLEAVCGEKAQALEITGPDTYRFTFPNLPCREGVRLTLRGTQWGRDVYRFAAGETDLLAYADGPVPVCARVNLEPERILTLTKVTEGGEPLADQRFSVYLAASAEALAAGQVRLNAFPTPRELERIQTPEGKIGEITTDDTGRGTYVFAPEDPDGVYLVVETPSAAVTPAEPCYITVPGEAEATVSLRLDGTPEARPSITLRADGERRRSVSFGDSLHWQITATLPPGLSAARGYTITDALPEGLNLEPDSLVVSLKNGESAACLLPDSHYVAQVHADKFTLSLTPAGMAWAAGAGTLMVDFRGSLTEAAVPGKAMTNLASLEYTSAAGLESYACEAVTVTTGGLTARKTDARGRGLAGVVFRLARQVRPGEKPQGKLTVQGRQTEVVYESFCPGSGLAEPVADRVTTDETGIAHLSGLAWGSYYLVEVRSPVGFRCGEPVAVTIGEGSAGDPLTLSATHYFLPDTGGAGVLILTLLGLCAMALACGLLVWQRQWAGER